MHSASDSSLRFLTFPPATIAAGMVVEATPGLIDAGGVKILRDSQRGTSRWEFFLLP